jgi:DNA-binding PadR family transcriptional regulator
VDSQDGGTFNDLLERWEETYKKGLLSFWMLLLLAERPTYAFEMKGLVEELSQGTLSADSNSLYRALNRFNQMGLITSEVQPNPQGPDRRYYSLAPKGRRLLASFIRRNLLIFQSPVVVGKMAALASQPVEEGTHD